MYCDFCGKKVDNGLYCEHCGKEQTIYGDENNQSLRPIKINTQLKSKKLILKIVVVILILIGVIYWMNPKLFSLSKNKPIVIENKPVDNSKSVVNILCDKGGGSGVILSYEGMILTNNHVVSGEDYCFVTLADADTGAPKEMYVAEPIILSKLSKQYDIAFLNIIDVYTDEDDKKYGEYPRSFPMFETPTGCSTYVPKLGDSVRIYGYPVTSGGLNLTVTDGIISSFSEYGEILTTAQIDNGNSGGLAVNKDGCYLGIPSAVVSGNYQNLGVIISQSIISEFSYLYESQSPDIEKNVSYQAAESPKKELVPTDSSNPKIDCIGPDGKHLSITQQECDDFNKAWQPKIPTASVPKSNYYQDNSSSGCTSCPANSYCLYGSCICNNGFSKNYSTGQCESCPANSTGSYGSCICNDGYTKNYSTNQCEPCPSNSHGSYGSCTCNDGYSKNYSSGQCEPCPANSTGTYGYCSCNSGYTKNYSTGQCEKSN